MTLLSPPSFCLHLQGFEVVRLKEKLGTRQLPTAELRLQGMRALKASGRQPGVQAA
jgi:hypothetical protein